MCNCGKNLKQINVSSLSTISQEQLLNLYRQGYSISTNIKPSIKSTGTLSTALNTVGLVVLGIGVYCIYKWYDKSK